MKERSPEWKRLRLSLAATLFVNGPSSAASMEDGARRHNWSVNTLISVARSLGVESYEHKGETYWHLPANVVPFIPRDHRRPYCYRQAAGAAPPDGSRTPPGLRRS